MLDQVLNGMAVHELMFIFDMSTQTHTDETNETNEERVLAIHTYDLSK